MLNVPLFNPSRMQLEHLKQYWNHWVSSAEEDDPFCFLHEDHALDLPNSTDQDRSMEEDDLLTLAIDEGLPLPCDCLTSAGKSNLLQTLAPDSDYGQTCHHLIRLVDSLEVG
jgi:hypothetical protein